MRSLNVILGSAVALASCGPKTLALPDVPVDRAATCGVVAAAGARAKLGKVQGALPFDAQTRILHYALLAGAEGESFDADAAGDASKRMTELQDKITSGKWRDLAPACDAAYPAANATQVTLPADKFEAGLQCDELANFLDKAMRSQESDYVAELGKVRDLGRKFDTTLGPGLRAKVGTDLPAQTAARHKALAAVAKLGPPAAVIRQCSARFG